MLRPAPDHVSYVFRTIAGASMPADDREGMLARAINAIREIAHPAPA